MGSKPAVVRTLGLDLSKSTSSLNTFMAIDFDKIEDSPHLLDILLQMEDVLDSNDIYVFKNWFAGIVVEGPIVRRYWFDMTLRYPLDKEPDEAAAKRLTRLGVRVTFSQVTVSDDKDKKGEDQKPTHHEVKLSIPSRLISAMNTGELDFYDEEVDTDDVESAQDAGMNDETAYQNPDGEESAEGGEPGMGEDKGGPPGGF